MNIIQKHECVSPQKELWSNVYDSTLERHDSFTNISKKFSYRTKAFIVQLSLTALIGGIIPLVLIAVFSILASIRLKKLTENFPGERNHHLQRIKDRYLTSKALIALAMLCASTYLPYDVAVTVILSYYPNIEDFITHLATGVGTWFWIIKFAQAALLLNPALNPLVLYFLSSKFRRYFKAYLCCRTRDLDQVSVTHL